MHTVSVLYVALETEHIIVCISQTNRTELKYTTQKLCTHSTETALSSMPPPPLSLSLSLSLPPSLMTKYSSACSASPVGFDSADDTVPVAVLMLFSPERAH